FNEDEAVDIAAGSEFGNDIKIYLNDGDEDGDFTAGTPKTGIDGTSMTTGFLNGDEVPDLAVGDAGTGKAVILLGDGAGGFSAPATSPENLPGAPRSIVAADFNNDSKADLVAAGGGTPGFAAVMLGDGNGDFAAPSSSPEAVGSVPTAIAAAPLNAD